MKNTNPDSKPKRDQLSMMGDARREGLAEGLAKDSMLGTIQTLQGVLDLPVT